MTSATDIKRPQVIQTYSTLDATSIRWDWNYLIVTQVIQSNRFGGKDKSTSFLQLKLTIRTCLASTKKNA